MAVHVRGRPPGPQLIFGLQLDIDCQPDAQRIRSTRTALLHPTAQARLQVVDLDANPATCFTRAAAEMALTRKSLEGTNTSPPSHLRW